MMLFKCAAECSEIFKCFNPYTTPWNSCWHILFTHNSLCCNCCFENFPHAINFSTPLSPLVFFHQKVLISLLYIVLNNVILVGYLKSNLIKVRFLCSSSKWQLLKDDCLGQIVSLEIATSFPRTNVQSGILSRHLYGEKIERKSSPWPIMGQIFHHQFRFFTRNAPQPKAVDLSVAIFFSWKNNFITGGPQDPTTCDHLCATMR